jgi:hypothetical protein
MLDQIAGRPAARFCSVASNLVKKIYNNVEAIVAAVQRGLSKLRLRRCRSQDQGHCRG